MKRLLTTLLFISFIIPVLSGMIYGNVWAVEAFFNHSLNTGKDSLEPLLCYVGIMSIPATLMLGIMSISFLIELIFDPSDY